MKFLSSESTETVGRILLKCRQANWWSWHKALRELVQLNNARGVELVGVADALDGFVYPSYADTLGKQVLFLRSMLKDQVRKEQDRLTDVGSIGEVMGNLSRFGLQLDERICMLDERTRRLEQFAHIHA